MSLVIRNITKRFESLTALDNVSLEVPNGTFVCFLGPSGCGKTTLLRVIAGLEDANSGSVEMDGSDLSRLPARDRNFGIVFQSYSLFPSMTVAKNVAYGLECRRWQKDRITARVDEMLNLVQLKQHAQKRPDQLSGGQQQRIALARAMAPEPSLLLLDEPLSALDAKVREELRTEIRAVQRRLGITTIMVTHDQDEALAMSDLVVVMNRGTIEQIGTPQELYEHPATVFVADFIGGMNWLDTRAEPSGRVLLGQVSLAAPEGMAGGRRLGLRPEHVGVGAPDQPGENRVPGRVLDVAFQGNLTRITVAPDMPPSAPAHRPITAEIHGHGPIPRIDDRVSVHLPVSAMKTFATT